MELIDSRPDLPRQTYQHCTRTTSDWNTSSASLDYCNTQPVSRYSAGSVTDQHCVSAAGVSSSRNLPSNRSVPSQTSSKSSMTSTDQQDRTSNRGFTSYQNNTQSSVRSSVTGSSGLQSNEDWRPIRSGFASYQNTTRSSSSLSRTAGSSNELQPTHHGQSFTSY